jgi:DNA-binding NarL/FixJ family response regulator
VSFTILVMVEAAQSHELVRRLQQEGCAALAAQSWAEGMQQIRDRAVDGVIVDPALSAAPTCPEVVGAICRQTSPRTAVILLTSDSNLESCRKCSLVRLGMLDCVDTPADSGDVVARMLWLLSYGTPRPARWPSHTLLSPREQSLLRLLRAGCSDREIATRLEVGEKAVARHISEICRKLEVPGRTAAVALSYRKPLFALSACDAVSVVSAAAAGGLSREG